MSTHDDINFNSPDIQQEILEEQAKSCHHGSTPSPDWCPEIWDHILCWPATAPGELAELPCPSYFAGFDSLFNATRQCMPNGQWYWNPETNSTWTNYSQCYTDKFVTVLMDMPDVQSDNGTLIKKYLPVIKTMSTIGYAVSFSTLVVAFCILAAIKKLRCPRNMLHMHLFVSFMTRAFMALLKEMLFIAGTGLSSNVLIRNGQSYWRVDDANNSSPNWHCKAFTSLWQYFILANYFWILMEGLYLHNLVFFALFTDSNSSIAGYVALGWGLPAIFVIPWIAMRVALEDTYCWTTHKTHVFLAIRIPTIISILINFFLFINIVRVLLLKLRSTVCEETQRYKRWARSTLVLVPLFGVHYTVFLGLSYSIGVDEKVELIWLTGDQLFASFQGFFVAVLYCFLNAEVRAEVSRVVRSARCPHFGSQRWDARSSTRCNSTCSCNNTKTLKEKHLKKIVWWKLPWAFIFHKQPVHRSTHSMASTQDVTTRGCSLASSRGYLENVGRGSGLGADTNDQITYKTSALYTDRCSFFSNTSEDKIERAQDQHHWNHSECCSLTITHFPDHHDDHENIDRMISTEKGEL